MMCLGKGSIIFPVDDQTFISDETIALVELRGFEPLTFPILIGMLSMLNKLVKYYITTS